MKRLDYYYINRGTCAIIPIDKEVSKVIELDNIFIVDRSTTDIVDDSCKFFGSSYKGRFVGAKNLLKMNYKLPIVIEELNNIIFFPTTSPRDEDCTWISLNNITSYTKHGAGSKIVFSESCSIDTYTSYYTIENQIFRATMLESLMRRRKNI